MDQELLDDDNRLKVAERLGGGMDNLEIKAAKGRDIKVVFRCP
ncbi:hypothetical protein RRV45_04205 [Bacillus sp. DTU_2020_1000418_1_SI_GHA_SEK_038]|nr:hypothetical protein [Bacillus sp. DTU_2020_1000418_1_SI_GHA_SEK_038]WNS77528.1 hypothetical protein RRV45_04205 [Bacillus sp. DTU_2020_1000418_1_SI_GHA_SEK_038]